MSILSQTKPPSSPEDYKIKALLVGPSKGGKSTSSMTLPGKKLSVDLDGRGAALVGFKDVEVLRDPFIRHKKNDPQPFLNMIKLKDELWSQVEDEELKYDSLIIDGLSSLKRICMDFCMTLAGADRKTLSTMPGGGPSQAHYGPHIHATDQLINQILPLPMHIAFTGHTYTFEDDLTNQIESWPNVYGRGLRSEIGSWFDEVYFCSGEGKKGFFWETQPQRRMSFLGSTLNRMGKFWNPSEPIKIDFESKGPIGFEDLIERRFKK